MTTKTNKQFLKKGDITITAKQVRIRRPVATLGRKTTNVYLGQTQIDRERFSRREEIKTDAAGLPKLLRGIL